MVKIVRLPKPASDLLLLHIALKWTNPKIWRRLAGPETSPWANCTVSSRP